MIKEGQEIILWEEGGRNYLLKAERKIFHTDKGVVNLEETIGKDFGDFILTSKNHKFFIFYPLISDFVMKVRRRTQILYPKDLGYTIFKMGIGSGSRVIEAGCGSGALTMVLAFLVSPNGKVYSYEIREEFLKLAQENLKRVNLEKFVEFHLKDVSEGFLEEGVDAVLIDLPEPWICVEHAHKALNGGAPIFSISPTYNQVERMVSELRKVGFGMIETVEILERKILVRDGRTRPKERMVSHTGFLTLARKIKK